MTCFSVLRRFRVMIPIPKFLIYPFDLEKFVKSLKSQKIASRTKYKKDLKSSIGSIDGVLPSLSAFSLLLAFLIHIKLIREKPERWKNGRIDRIGNIPENS